MAAKAKQPKTGQKAIVTQAMNQLVSQFSQPLAFLRELIQNSLDASTNIVEVEVDFDKQDNHCYIQVKDTGTGMDRAVIDSKLTCLFSSSKEDDLTKIGKFGIGFVSIFAIKPTLVVLDTGKDGQSWRLLFKPDRSFERRKLAEPVEGTCITVYLDKPRKELAKLQADCLETVSFWCRHASVEIQFNGQKINEPFQLPEAAFSYHHKTDITEVVVSPTTAQAGFAGYYNSGLTLLEKKSSPLAYVSFKLRSNFLEHTITRDNIIEDDNYKKAMAQVEIAAYEKMPKALLDELCQHDTPELWKLAAVLINYPQGKALLRKAPIFSSRTEKLKAKDLPSITYTHPQIDDFWLAVEATGATIVRAETDEFCFKLLSLLSCNPIPIEQAFIRYSLVTSLKVEEESLLKDIATYNKYIPSPVLVATSYSPPESSSLFCYPVKLDLTACLTSAPAKTDYVGICRGHGFWQTLLTLYKAQPELALSLASRRISLDLKLGTRGDLRLFSSLIKKIRTS